MAVSDFSNGPYKWMISTIENEKREGGRKKRRERPSLLEWWSEGVLVVGGELGAFMMVGRIFVRGVIL